MAENARKELVEQLNDALMLEHAARNQYLAHAELLKGIYAEPVIKRLREIASDEEKHQQKFRTLIGDYLGGEPVMDSAETHRAGKTEDILKVNLKDEKHAIDVYEGIYKKVVDSKDALKYEFETLEHEIRHVIMDEQEHVTELSLLLGV